MYIRYKCRCISICMYIYIYVCMYVCVCLCVRVTIDYVNMIGHVYLFLGPLTIISKLIISHSFCDCYYMRHIVYTIGTIIHNH